VLAQIDDFVFEIDNTAYDVLKREIEYRYNSSKRIGNFDDHQAIGKYEEKIQFDGVLIAKKQSQLDDFEKMAQEKTPKTLALPSGRAKSVIIKKLEIERSSFLKTGEFLRQNFKISLKVVGDD